MNSLDANRIGAMKRYIETIPDTYFGKLIGEFIAALEAAKSALLLNITDWATTDDHVRNAARIVLPALWVDGDSNAVPNIETVVDELVDELKHARESSDWNADQVTQAAHENAMLRAENARLREALGQYVNHSNWDCRPIRYGSPDDAYDIWQGGDDVNGWETAERALAANKTGAQE